MNIILKFLEGFCVQLNWNIRELRRSKKNRATCVDRQGKCCALYECVTVVVTLFEARYVMSYFGLYGLLLYYL